jgi:hypothetical protein
MLGDGIRRNFATISENERTLFISAVRQLDNPASGFVYPNNFGHEGADLGGNITYWDMQEQIHKDAHAHGINVHVGPAFIPWHRVIVNRFEALLRQVDPRLSLHYWDWTTDPRQAVGSSVNLFTANRMGASEGNAGPPFQDFESTEPGHALIWRNVAGGAAPPQPPQIPSDADILASSDFTAFDNIINGPGDAHGIAHGYIGGTLSDPHYSFSDPFVFLLHSNLDRLWAMWQRAPGHLERLNPATAYGNILADRGLPADYFDEWVQPWAGIDRNGVVQTDLNPWRSDPAQQAHIPYNDLCCHSSEI